MNRVKYEWLPYDTNQWSTETVEFGLVIIEELCDEDGDFNFGEWDICIDDCWQGPFSSKFDCLNHLTECIKDKNDHPEAYL